MGCQLSGSDSPGASPFMGELPLTRVLRVDLCVPVNRLEQLDVRKAISQGTTTTVVEQW